MSNLTSLKRERKDLMNYIDELTIEYENLGKEETNLNNEYRKEQILNKIFESKRKANYLDVEIYNLENELKK